MSHLLKGTLKGTLNGTLKGTAEPLVAVSAVDVFFEHEEKTNAEEPDCSDLSTIDIEERKRQCAEKLKALGA